MTYLFFAITLYLCWKLRRRMIALEVSAEQPVTRGELGSLTRRVYALEHAGRPFPAEPAPAAAPPAPEPTPAPPPAFDIRVPAELNPSITLVAPEPVVEPVAEPMAEPAPQHEAQPSLADRVRPMLGNQEWEAIVGGSLLNKAGAILLVVGIALFLAWSFRSTSPLGRAAIAFAASLALLGAGLWFERSARYTTFARGLIGAGWAALYATSYAIYAVPAARIIDSPVLGSLGMIAVAIAMTGHSLRYRAQAATAVAYSAVFAALAVTPSSPLAVASLIPIAISILFLSARFNWNWLPLFGLIATYVTCISRGESGAPLAEVQSLFLAYWFIFELFDLRRVKLGLVSRGAEWIFPINTLGFLGLSYSVWSSHYPDHLWYASACGAALFLASSIARACLLPASAEAGADLFQRFRAGAFEASLTVAAALAALAVIGRAHGVWTGAILALEAEALYLAGVRFSSGFLRKLAVAAFALSLWNSVAGDLSYTHTTILGYAFRQWTPVLVFHAALFYLNRGLRGSRLFSFAATALIFAALFDAPEAYWGMAMAIYGLLLLEFGIARRLPEFRAQAYFLLGAGTFLAAAYTLDASAGGWSGLAVTLATLYAISLRARFFASEPRGLDSAMLDYAAPFATAALAYTLVWRLTPLGYLALAWSLVSLAFFELGSLRLPAGLRRCLGPALLGAVVAAIQTHSEFAKFPAVAVTLTYLGIAFVAFASAIQITLQKEVPASDWEQGPFREILFAVGLASSLRVLWMVLPDPYVGIAWLALAMAVTETGRALRIESARLVVPCIAFAGFLFALVNYIDPPVLAGSITAAAGLFALYFQAARMESRRAALLYSVLGALVVVALLFGRVSGGLLTVSWGIEGLALLAIGFIARDRALRLEGLSLFLVCTLKLFLYDLRNLETGYRILSFIALGLILLSVSWIYTRFREQLARML